MSKIDGKGWDWEMVKIDTNTNVIVIVTCKIRNKITTMKWESLVKQKINSYAYKIYSSGSHYFHLSSKFIEGT